VPTALICTCGASGLSSPFTPSVYLVSRLHLWRKDQRWRKDKGETGQTVSSSRSTFGARDERRRAGLAARTGCRCRSVDAARRAASADLEWYCIFICAGASKGTWATTLYAKPTTMRCAAMAWWTRIAKSRGRFLANSPVCPLDCAQAESRRASQFGSGTWCSLPQSLARLRGVGALGPTPQSVKSR